MKKIITVFCAAALLTSCGNNESKTSTGSETPAATAEKKSTSTGMTAEQQKGFDLIMDSKMDCFGCHKVAEKLQGPAYVDVAKRYAGKPGIEDTLAQKIIKGGAGNWGNVPMAAHPQISEADAKLMVAYILSTPNQ